jgi:hypothetical protein
MDPPPSSAAAEGRKPVEDYLLRGFAFCAWCGRALYTRRQSGSARPSRPRAREAREHLDVCPSCRAAHETFTRLHPSGA